MTMLLGISTSADIHIYPMPPLSEYLWRTMLLGISTLICGYTYIPHAPSVRVSANDHVTRDIHICGYTYIPHVPSVRVSVEDHVTRDIHTHLRIYIYTPYPSVRVSANDHLLRVSTYQLWLTSLLDISIVHRWKYTYTLCLLSSVDHVTWDSMDDPQRSLASNLGFNGSSTEISS